MLKNIMLVLICIILTFNIIVYADNLQNQKRVIDMIENYSLALEQKDFDSLKEITTEDMYNRTKEYFKRINNILFADESFIDEIRTNNSTTRIKISVGYNEFSDVSFLSKTSQYSRPVYITLIVENGKYYISDTNIYDKKDIPTPIILVIMIVSSIYFIVKLFKKIDKTGKIF